MNILIYKFDNIEIVEKLIQKNRASLYFAISKEDIFRIAKNINPEFMIIGNNINLDNKLIVKIVKLNPNLHIYCIEDNKTDFNELKLTDQITMEKVEFKSIIN